MNLLLRKKIKKILYSFLILCFLNTGFFIPIKKTNADEIITPDKLLINEIQITNGAGLTSNDFIRIYNPNDYDINLQGYRLIKRTKTGTNDISIKSWTSETIISANSYHTWANSKNDFAISINADSSTAQTISLNNAVAIIFGNLNKGKIIDSIGWGEYSGILVETSAYPINPKAGQTLLRQNNSDTNNNSIDFILSEKEINTENNENEQNENEQDENEQNENEQDENEQDENEQNENNNDSKINQSTSSGGSIPNYNTNTRKTNKKNKKNNGIENKNKEKKEKEKLELTKIYISEILPNPSGIDQPLDCLACGEFIELYNAGSKTINLQNWRIKIDNRPEFIINHYLPLLSKQRIIFYKYQTNLMMLNNSGKIRLYEPNKKKAKQLIKYKQAPPNTSYNLLSDNKTWEWSKLITPGKINKINYAPIVEFYAPDEAEINEQIIFDASDCYDQDDKELKFSWNFGNGNTSKEKNPKQYFNDSGKYTIQLTVDDGINKVSKTQIIKINTYIKNNKNKKEDNKKNNRIENKTNTTNLNKPISKIINNFKNKLHTFENKLTATGVVIVKPGIFSSQFFYIMPMHSQNDTYNTAIQIYNYNKIFPVLLQGDYIEVIGEPSDIQTDNRLKIKNINDIKILDHDYTAIERIIKCDQINQNLKGQLVSIYGQIIDKEGNNIYLQDETGEAIIYLSPGTNLKNNIFEINNNIQVIGLARQIRNEIKIMPRSDKDIIKQNNQTNNRVNQNNSKNDFKNNSQILGKKIEKNINQNKKILNNKVKDNKIKSDMIFIPPSNTKQKLLEYLLVLSAGIIITLLIYIIKLHNNIKNKKNN